MENVLYYGIGLVVITWLVGLAKAKPYTTDNFQQVANIQRKLCISYVIGFGAIAYGGTLTLGDDWWAWLVIGLAGMMGFGAFLEAMKTLPNAPKDLQED